MQVVDTCAFISLAVGDVFELVLDEFDLVTTSLIVDELEATAEYDNRHGMGAATVLDHTDRFEILETTAPKLTSSRIDAGEASCVAAVRETGASFLVTDDFRALPELETLVAVDIALSPILIRGLVKRNVLTDSEARTTLERIARERNWLGTPIYRYALQLFE